MRALPLVPPAEGLSRGPLHVPHLTVPPPLGCPPGALRHHGAGDQGPDQVASYLLGCSVLVLCSILKSCFRGLLCSGRRASSCPKLRGIGLG